jgi:hypothetical protein
MQQVATKPSFWRMAALRLAASVLHRDGGVFPGMEEAAADQRGTTAQGGDDQNVLTIETCRL